MELSSYDWRNKVNLLIPTSQGPCGNCNELSVYSTIYDRNIINGKQTNEYSIDNCDGGSLNDTWLKYKKKYNLSKVYHIQGMKNIMNDIFHNGPVSSCFLLYPDFYSFFINNPKGNYNFQYHNKEPSLKA